MDVTTAVIAAQANTIQASFVAAAGAQLVEFSTVDEALAAVLNGEADATLADKASLLDQVEASDQLVFLEKEELIGGGVGMGIRKSDSALRDKFDAAIQSMKDDGTLNALIVKWKIGETF